MLVGHSGAGCLLPAIAQAVRHPDEAYLFVDAGLPHPGQSRLDEMDVSVPAVAQELRQQLTAGQHFPQWSEQDLSEELPDAQTRRKLLAEVQPRPLGFFTEVLPDVAGWPDAPAGYLLLTPGYRHFLEQAQRAGWPGRTLPAGHFHLLVDPAAVVLVLVDLLQQINEQISC